MRPTGEVPANYRDLVSFDLPVLIVSGERDPVTAATWGTALEAALPNAAHIIVPDAGHVPFGSCINGIQEAFWISTNPTGLSVGCMESSGG
jgi:pimeloyl-ACP methyl ester carboxylesterase